MHVTGPDESFYEFARSNRYNFRCPFEVNLTEALADHYIHFIDARAEVVGHEFGYDPTSRGSGHPLFRQYAPMLREHCKARNLCCVRTAIRSTWKLKSLGQERVKHEMEGLDNRSCICNHRAMTSNDSVLYAATECIGLRARRLSRVVSRHYEEALRNAGLTPPQFSLLVAVAIGQSLSPIELARTLDLDKSTLSRNLRLLIRSKLLVREAPSVRGHSVRISRKGREVLHRAFPAWKKAQEEVTGLLGADVASRLDGMIAATAKG